MYDAPMRAIGGPEDSYVYHGDREDWLVVIGETRDADALERSNYRSIKRTMEEDYGEDVAVERIGHWACGYIDFLIVNPDNAAAVADANRYRYDLTQYPVADEEDFSALEWEESEELMTNAQDDCERMGHSYADDSKWESDNGYQYTKACAVCGYTMQVDTDSKEYAWNDIPECNVEPAWNPNRFYTSPR